MDIKRQFALFYYSPQFYHLQIGNQRLQNIETHERFYGVPTVIATCAWVDMKELQLRVGHDFEDMRMTTYI